MSEIIYGLREVGGEFRYIGRTRRPLRKRLNSHRHKARHPEEASADYPVYEWMREVGPQNVEAVEILVVESGEASCAELAKISEYRSRGFDLLNSVNRQRGSDRPASRLTEEDVRSILAEGRWGPTDQIGKKWGVSGSNIRGILRGDYWRHIYKEVNSG